MYKTSLYYVISHFILDELLCTKLSFIYHLHISVIKIQQNNIKNN